MEAMTREDYLLELADETAGRLSDVFEREMKRLASKYKLTSSEIYKVMDRAGEFLVNHFDTIGVIPNGGGQ